MGEGASPGFGGERAKIEEEASESLSASVDVGGKMAV
jgi:hypothetical protein